jgi:hypothetical protein
MSIARIVPAVVLLLSACAPAGSSSQGAASATEIKVGAVLPLTGAFSASGNYFQQAYQLATDEVNSAGGLDVGGKKLPITLKILDDGSDTTKSRSLVEQLATQEKVNALLGGHVTTMFASYGNVAEHLKAGRLRALAAGTQTRIEMLPDLPTVAESGFKDYEVKSWFGTFAPAKTPKDTVAQLAGWFTAAMQAPEVKAKLDVQGLFPAGICGADFTAYVRSQFEDYGRIIREAKIKAD